MHLPGSAIPVAVVRDAQGQVVDEWQPGHDPLCAASVEARSVPIGLQILQHTLRVSGIVLGRREVLRLHPEQLPCQSPDKVSGPLHGVHEDGSVALCDEDALS